jgi:hypothetical protein
MAETMKQKTLVHMLFHPMTNRAIEEASTIKHTMKYARAKSFTSLLLLHVNGDGAIVTAEK